MTIGPRRRVRDAEIREQVERLTEVAVYAVSFTSVGVYLSYEAYVEAGSFVKSLAVVNTESIVFALASLFIIAFRMIYGKFPIENLRHYLQARRVAGLRNSARQTHGTMSRMFASELAELNIRRSTKVADSLFTRAGLYLLVGVLIACGAAVAFWAMFSENTLLGGTVTAHVAGAKEVAVSDISEKLLRYAPKFSFLLFLELIAFYFLRQYRVAMEEYRYYEEIQRNREDAWLVLTATDTYGKDSDIVDLIREGAFTSSVKKMSATDTTSILEARKLEKNDLELLVKFAEIFAREKK